MKLKHFAAAGFSVLLSAAMPLTALADTPNFAYDEATWAMLRDNVMTYEELPLLVETYNPDYNNNLNSFQDGRTTEDANDVRQKNQEAADDFYDQAEGLRDTADTLKSQLEAISDGAALLPQMGMGAAAGSGDSKGLIQLGATYAALQTSAAMLEQQALTKEQSVKTSYTDSQTRELDHRKTQKNLVISVQKLFASYNLARKTLPVLEKNIQVAQAQADAVQRKMGLGMATGTELLKAQSTVQSLQSALTSAQGNVEQLRQQLCLATGWKASDHPDIKDMPAADAALLDQMNPAADGDKAVSASLTLQKDRLLMANMTEGTTDSKNQTRTSASDEQNLRAQVTNLYNTAVQNRVAWQSAQAALASASRTWQTAQTKKNLGMLSQNEFLSEEANFLSAQIDADTAAINLQQAIESYNWAVQGY